MRRRVSLLALLAVIAIVWPPREARADIAPPRTPPGSTLVPGEAGTAVRMIAETVTLEVSADPRTEGGASARTHAVFTMHNVGHVDETMAVRFPLSFPDGSSDGAFEFPEISSIAVSIDGQPVKTRREMQPPIEAGGYRERDEVPWAVFDVSFPRARDVVVQVDYTAMGYGYYPQTIFEYVIETGAGWNDTIGRADIVVQLPYEASERNVFIRESNGSSASTPGATISGNQISWHYEDLEPTWEDNLQVILIAPALWESVIRATDMVAGNPGDGEAWGRLAKAYKEASRLPKGWLRDDPAGTELAELSEDAYQKCLALLPQDALWHYGYADLLWAEYYWGARMLPSGDVRGLLPRSLAALRTTLELDPGNQLAQDLLLEISLAVDGAVEMRGDEYVFLALTATPPPPTPFLGSPTQAAPTYEPPAATATATASEPAKTHTPEPTVVNPLCGAGALSLVLPLLALVRMRRRRMY